MAKYIIEGAHPIHGETLLPGAKNAVTKILIASILSEEPSFLFNVPNIKEIDLTLNLVRSFGVDIEQIDRYQYKVQRGSHFSNKIPEAEASHNRMAILTIAPLLHTFGKVILPKNMGGDKIGPRPINFHIDAYQKFGVNIVEKDSHYIFECDRLRGNKIELPFPSVSTTENILIASSLAKGTTVIKGAAVEPEVIDLILFLQKMGAIIDIQTNRTIIIEGVQKLRGTQHRILPDRISCASYAALAIASGGELEVIDAKQEHMLNFLNALKRMNAPFRITDRGILFGNGKKNKLDPLSLETGVHPGFMTDWQPPAVILMTQAEGLSTLHETVYENRLSYCSTLTQMGAHIQTSTLCLGGTPCRFQHKDFIHSCIVRGSSKLKGISMKVPDLRAGFSYVIAALCAEGKSEIDKVEEIERGYGPLHQILKSLGSTIQRQDT